VRFTGQRAARLHPRPRSGRPLQSAHAPAAPLTRRSIAELRAEWQICVQIVCTVIFQL
jgi:hypothetical protein